MNETSCGQCLARHSEDLVKDRNFVVSEQGIIQLTDAATGVQTDRKLQEGRHQALEARFANKNYPDEYRPNVKISTIQSLTTDKITYRQFLRTVCAANQGQGPDGERIFGTAIQMEAEIRGI